MTSFDKRREGYESKFAHDQDLKFKATARRNKLLGLWAAEKMGLSGTAAVGAFKDHVKINFFRGAALDDPRGLFNAGLDAKATRAIDLAQGDRLDEAALERLVRAAVALDRAPARPKSKGSR